MTIYENLQVKPVLLEFLVVIEFVRRCQILSAAECL